MANTDRLAEVAALMVERDEDFRPLDSVKLDGRSADEPLWRASDLQVVLGYDCFGSAGSGQAPGLV